MDVDGSRDSRFQSLMKGTPKDDISFIKDSLVFQAVSRIDEFFAPFSLLLLLLLLWSTTTTTMMMMMMMSLESSFVLFGGIATSFILSSGCDFTKIHWSSQCCDWVWEL